MSLGTLLTAQQVVEHMERLGFGVWGRDAVIKWTLEEPALRIALRAQQGKPHRYRMADVLEFHLQRCRKERAKGFTSGDPDLESRLERGLRLLLAGEEPAPRAAAPEARTLVLDPPAAPAIGMPISPAKGEGEAPPPPAAPWEQLNEPEALLAVLQGRDPRNWKATEEALKMRRARLIEERQLVPVDELQAALDLHTEHTRTAVQGWGPRVKSTLRDLVPAEQRHELDRAVDLAVEQLLRALASSDDLDAAEAEAS